MSESHIEKALVRAVKRRGGLALKFISPGMSGVPDRLILFSDGRLAFIEVKAPGEKMRPLQIKRKGQLEALGFLVYCLDDVKVIGEMLDELCAP
ncbi:VRR-NUC domain-containing protein [Desulfosporosinus sp.]|uniref:VRR-NUC domain-containing protein n=1 Tax=Desulfosporosinus sp. TaxID=157907 RepID=UPI0025B99B85|nr:VRR-NUC domain-containing protein [Desulfosporosinus sp.]MBC2723237.1 VRR-NUC domain-containing protein [Desulfosporosinus sp.]MBC2727112.1 VRR-NUC domain-containing protein [Desulfosporosinus sp.]